MFLLVFYLGSCELDDFVVQICALTAALLAFLGWRSTSAGPKSKIALSVILAIICAAAFWGQTSPRFERIGTPGQMNSWGVLHYYMGVKYFNELGYTDMYEQILAADAEDGRHLDKIRKIRNLHTYVREEIEGIHNFKRSDKFSNERWQEFKSDVNYFISLKGLNFWKHVLQDRGYNASPAWHFFAWCLTELLSIQNPTTQTILLLFDVFLVLGAFAFSVRAYGWSRSLLVLAALYVWIGTRMHIFGQIYILDWFAASWAALSAWRLGWARTCGALLAYATMVRIFPAAFFLGPILHAGAKLIRERRVGALYRRLFVSAFICAAVLFVAGGLHTRYGFGAWKMFANEIAFHRTHHIEGGRRLGLEHIFTVDFSHGWPKKLTKNDSFENAEKNKPFFRAIQLVMLGLLVLSVIRSDRHDAFLLGATLVFIGTIASRYYGAVFFLLLFLGIGAKGGLSDSSRGRSGGREMAVLVLDSCLFLILLAVSVADESGVRRYPTYLLANALLFVWFATLLAHRAFRNFKRPIFKPLGL